jgi:hypothetical protein
MTVTGFEQWVFTGLIFASASIFIYTVLNLFVPVQSEDDSHPED